MTKSVTITLDEPLLIAFRRMNGKINGSIGGKAKSQKKQKASRRNGKLALKARVEA